MFEVESQKVKQALGNNCLTIHHMGSTSIPGLAAKPIIDMAPVVKDIRTIDTKTLEALGYISRGEYGMPFRAFFQKGESLRTHHLHIWEEGHPEIQKHLLFRDFLRNHPKERNEYALLKTKLAQDFPDDPFSYGNGKIKLINEIITKSGFDAYLFVHALTEDQWNIYHFLRKDHSFNPQDARHDAHPKNHFHFVLSKGCTIIGASQVKFSRKKDAFIKFIAFNSIYQNQGLEVNFSNLLERWIYYQNRILLH